MNVDDLLAETTVSVSTDRYAVVKTDQVDPEAFAVVRDDNETTVVAEEGTYDEAAAIEVEPGWKVLTFETALPFDLVGFLARVATALAEQDISIFALSAYSTDHVLVKAEDVDTALKALDELGCDVPVAGS